MSDVGRRPVAIGFLEILLEKLLWRLGRLPAEPPRDVPRAWNAIKTTREPSVQQVEKIAGNISIRIAFSLSTMQRFLSIAIRPLTLRSAVDVPHDSDLACLHGSKARLKPRTVHLRLCSCRPHVARRDCEGFDYSEGLRLLPDEHCGVLASLPTGSLKQQQSERTESRALQQSVLHLCRSFGMVRPRFAPGRRME
jgi:hypothetical protein